MKRYEVMHMPKVFPRCFFFKKPPFSTTVMLRLSGVSLFFNGAFCRLK